MTKSKRASINTKNNNILLHIVYKIESAMYDLKDKYETEIVIKQLKTIVTLIKKILNKDDHKNESRSNIKHKKLTNNKINNILNFPIENDNLKDRLKNGSGICFYNENDIYEGELRKGLREGKGKMIWQNGDIYEGHFKRSVIERSGIYYCKNENIYIGSLKNNKPNGKGIFYYVNGNKSKGEFKNGIKNGKGIK